jgi:hypothetical protein
MAEVTKVHGGRGKTGNHVSWGLLGAGKGPENLRKDLYKEHYYFQTETLYMIPMGDMTLLHFAC